MSDKSINMCLYLSAFKEAAAEGAVVELKMRLLAGKIPALQKHAHSQRLGDIEKDLIEHFKAVLSEQEKETLRLCRELRNKVLHTDFCAARKKLGELGHALPSGRVVKIDLSEKVTAEEVRSKMEVMKAGKEGVWVADTKSTGEGGVFGWFLEAGAGGDFQKAADAFKKAEGIVERLLGIEGG